MDITVTIKNASGGDISYTASDVPVNFRGWNDSVGGKFYDNAKRQVADFNTAHNEVWNKIKAFPDFDPNDFKYTSMADKIYSLEA